MSLSGPAAETGHGTHWVPEQVPWHSHPLLNQSPSQFAKPEAQAHLPPLQSALAPQTPIPHGLQAVGGLQPET